MIIVSTNVQSPVFTAGVKYIYLSHFLSRWQEIYNLDKFSILDGMQSETNKFVMIYKLVMRDCFTGHDQIWEKSQEVIRIKNKLKETSKSEKEAMQLA